MKPAGIHSKSFRHTPESRFKGIISYINLQNIINSFLFYKMIISDPKKIKIYLQNKRAQIWILYLRLSYWLPFYYITRFEKVPKLKKGERMDDFLRRIDARHSFIISRHLKLVTDIKYFNSTLWDLSGMSKKDQKKLKEYQEHLQLVSAISDQAFRESFYRWEQEKLHR